MSRYRIFNQVIESAFPLPELPAASGEPQLVISEYSPATEQVEPFEQRYVWRGPDGVEICRVSRLTGCYQFSYPDQATFLIPDAGHMLCTRASSCSPETFRHLLINQAIPRLMAHRGRLILHASAVSLKAGECFLFLGDSGYGKSTLAASLLAAGATVLADDCVELSVHRGRVYARGAFPGLRLRDDSQRQALPPQRELIRSMGYYNGKQVFRVAQPPDDGYRVTQAFVLNDPLCPAPDLSHQRVDGMQAVMTMLRGLFRLDPAEDNDRGPEFASVCALFAAGLEVIQLAYPRDFERLADVQRHLLATANSGVSRAR